MVISPFFKIIENFVIFWNILLQKYLTILKSLRILFFKTFGIVLMKFLFQNHWYCAMLFFSFLLQKYLIIFKFLNFYCWNFSLMRNHDEFWLLVYFLSFFFQKYHYFTNYLKILWSFLYFWLFIAKISQFFDIIVNFGFFSFCIFISDISHFLKLSFAWSFWNLWLLRLKFLTFSKSLGPLWSFLISRFLLQKYLTCWNIWKNIYAEIFHFLKSLKILRSFLNFWNFIAEICHLL